MGTQASRSKIIKKIENVAFIGALFVASLAAFTSLPRSARAEDPAPNPAAPVSPLQQEAQLKNAFLDSHLSSRVSDELVRSLWSAIQANWDGSRLPLRINGGKNDRSALIRSRLDGLVQDLLQKGGFRVLTAQAIVDLGVSDILCQNPDHCTSVEGLYLPLNHLIAIDTSLRQDELEKVLLHELFHAYQFTYRFPFDLTKLTQIAAQGRIKADELELYLDYYYESQANWKAMLYSPDLVWLMEQKNPALEIGLTNLGTSAIGGLIAMGSTAGVGFGIYGGVISAELLSANHISNTLLPKFAQTRWERSFEILNKDHSAFALPELIPLNDFRTWFTGFSSYDFGFHEKYGRAIQKYYFGPELFLNHSKRGDLKIYNELHNNYFDRLEKTELLETDPKCSQLIESIRHGSYSPMVSWLELPQAAIESCPAYAGAGQAQPRQDYTDSFLSQENSSKNGKGSSFQRGLPTGGEGGRPGLRVLPQLRIYPEPQK